MMKQYEDEEDQVVSEEDEEGEEEEYRHRGGDLSDRRKTETVETRGNK